MRKLLDVEEKPANAPNLPHLLNGILNGVHRIGMMEERMAMAESTALMSPNGLSCVVRTHSRIMIGSSLRRVDDLAATNRARTYYVPSDRWVYVWIIWGAKSRHVARWGRTHPLLVRTKMRDSRPMCLSIPNTLGGRLAWLAK